MAEKKMYQGGNATKEFKRLLEQVINDSKSILDKLGDEPEEEKKLWEILKKTPVKHFKDDWLKMSPEQEADKCFKTVANTCLDKVIEVVDSIDVDVTTDERASYRRELKQRLEKLR
jgi:hypothetical protein